MDSRLRKILGSFLLCCLPFSAFASLGGNAEPIATDQSELQATMQTASQIPTMPSYSVRQMMLPKGTVVREYVTANQVFGVAWTGAYMPNLKTLLGDVNYQIYLNALVLNKTPRQRTFSLDKPDVVIHAEGLPGHFKGQAYLPYLLPQGVTAADIR